jgi:hypothetical protein
MNHRRPGPLVRKGAAEGERMAQAQPIQATVMEDAQEDGIGFLAEPAS